MLMSKFNYRHEDILVLRDDDINRLPTRQNMLEKFKWLVYGAMAGDSLFFHFSG